MFFGPDFFKIQKNILIEPSSCFSIKKIKSVYHFPDANTVFSYYTVDPD